MQRTVRWWEWSRIPSKLSWKLCQRRCLYDCPCPDQQSEIKHTTVHLRFNRRLPKCIIYLTIALEGLNAAFTLQETNVSSCINSTAFWMTRLSGYCHWDVEDTDHVAALVCSIFSSIKRFLLPFLRFLCTFSWLVSAPQASLTLPVPPSTNKDHFLKIILKWTLN